MTPELFYGLGAVVLLVGIAYALVWYNNRNKSADPITEAATREQYDHPDRYQRTQKNFERAAEKAKERAD